MVRACIVSHYASLEQIVPSRNFTGSDTKGLGRIIHGLGELVVDKNIVPELPT